MARIISIVNQKGGTGKSACTANLAVGLAQKNMKVLIVDADPQSDVSAGFGYRDCDDSNETLTALMDAVMKDEDIPSECFIRHQAEGIDIICSNIGLAGTEVQLVNAMSREYVLKQILYGIKDQYDVVIIDCMPSLGMITINALAASDEVLIPVEASYLPIKGLMEKVEEMDEVVMAEIQKSQGEYKPLAKVEELEEANYNMIDNVLNNMPPKKEPYLEYFATECDEFHDMGAYEKSTDVNQIAAVYEKYRENPKTAYLGCSMGIIYRDPEDSYYDEAEFAIVKGNTVFGNLMDDVRFYGELALVREGIEKIHEALPDYKYVPMRDVREAMYPEKMTTEQLAEALDEIAEAFDPYEYRDNVERGENTVQEVMLDLRSGNIHSYISYLKDIVDEECDLSVRAGVLIERLKAYEPELPKDMEPMVYVNYCEESDLMNPRCQKLSELDAKTAEMDKEWYAKRDPKTEEPTKIAKIYVTVYYAEKGEQMLHHFKKSMDIGNGHGGIVSQLKYDNEMKLTDEYWINYQKGKGSEEFQKYMEDLTDMQNHVLPYLQSFCNLEEKGVKERREQQIAERYEGRADERVTSTEANEVVKDVGKTDRKPAQQKQAVDGKDKKLSIHERLEINKRIIQEKQGKDKTERGVDLGVRTV